VVTAMQRLRMQFDVLAPGALLPGIDAPVDHRMIVIPEVTRVSPEVASALRAFLASGGTVLVSGAALLDDEGNPILPELGISSAAPPSFSHTFLRESAQDDGFPHVMYEPSLRLSPQAGAESLYTMVEPYFERSWDAFSGHDYTPAGPQSPYAAVIACGGTVSTAAPIFTAVGRHAADAYIRLLARCVGRLLPEPLLRVSGPAHLETSVADSPTARVVHLLSFLPSRQAEAVNPRTGLLEGIDLVNDAFPLVDVDVSVRLENPPKAVSLQPHAVPLDWKHADGRLRTTVSVPDGHGMIVIER
jgi:hypothetical protein